MANKREKIMILERGFVGLGLAKSMESILFVSKILLLHKKYDYGTKKL